VSDQRALRRHNLALVLGHVARRGPRSRARLAEETGLNKSTVSALVRELIELDLLAWTVSEEAGAPGRPARGVGLSGRRFAGVGVKLAPLSAAVRVCDLAGATRHARAIALDSRGADPVAVVARLAGLVREALDAIAVQGLSATGVTLAVPGLVRGDSGVLLAAPALGWPSVALGRELAAALARLSPPVVEPSLPVVVEKEASAGALGELWRGAGREHASFVYVSGEGSVEAGVVIDGRLFSGAEGLGGELGHLRVEPEGLDCPCGGSGCLETRVGAAALAERAGMPGADSVTAAQALAARARAGDGLALAAIEEIGRWLGQGLAWLSNLLNPEAIVLGGHFAPLAQWLTAPIEGEVRRRVLSARWSRPVIAAEAPGSDPVGHGAAVRALDPLLGDPARAAVGYRPSASKVDRPDPTSNTLRPFSMPTKRALEGPPAR
jgi:predicted NBD/HSP70 family sugar kinase